MKQKTLYIIIGILFVTLLIIGGYVLDEKIIGPKLRERAINDVARYQSTNDKIVFWNGSDAIEDSILNICGRLG